MSVSYTCDWCGEPIESERGAEYGEAHLSSMGLHEDYGLAYKEVGHFHAGRYHDSDSCLLQAIRLVKDHFGSMPKAVSDERLQRDERDQEHRAWREARDRWRRASWDERERWMLQALGDARLTASELVDRIEANGSVGTNPNEVRRLAARMVAAGVLDAVKEPYKSAGRYRYQHRRELDGPIADLERAYHAEEGA